MQSDKPETLNLAYHEKRLIILALRKTGGRVADAYKLNVPCGKYMNEKTYYNRLHEYGIDLKKFRDA